MSRTSVLATPIGTQSVPSGSAGPILFALGIGGVLGFGVISHDWIAASFMLLVICLSGFGYRSGAIKVSAGVAGMLVAIRYAVPAAKMVAPQTAKFLTLSESVEQPANVVIAGCLIALFVYIALRLVFGVIVDSIPQLNGMNRWLGGVLGAGQGVLISVALLFGLVTLEPIAKQQLGQSQANESQWSVRPIAAKVVNWSAQVRLSAIGPLLDVLEPYRARFDARIHGVAELISAEAEGLPGRSLKTILPDLLERVRNDPHLLRDVAAETGLTEQTLRSRLKAAEAGHAP